MSLVFFLLSFMDRLPFIIDNLTTLKNWELLQKFMSFNALISIELTGSLEREKLQKLLEIMDKVEMVWEEIKSFHSSETRMADIMKESWWAKKNWEEVGTVSDFSEWSRMTGTERRVIVKLVNMYKDRNR